MAKLSHELIVGEFNAIVDARTSNELVGAGNPLKAPKVAAFRASGSIDPEKGSDQTPSPNWLWRVGVRAA
jgi:hypothetical protein